MKEKIEKALKENEHFYSIKFYEDHCCHISLVKNLQCINLKTIKGLDEQGFDVKISRTKKYTNIDDFIKDFEGKFQDEEKS